MEMRPPWHRRQIPGSFMEFKQRYFFIVTQRMIMWVPLILHWKFHENIQDVPLLAAVFITNECSFPIELALT